MTATIEASTAWRNRIVATGEEAPDQLLANPANWRIHPKAQQDALASVLDGVGWVGSVLVNQRTGHVVDGHLRVSLALSRGEPTVPVAYVDLSLEEEKLILASLDPLAAMAGTDDAKLRELLEEVSIPNSELEAHIVSFLAKGAQPGLTDPDDIPLPPDEPTTKPGDIWVLGDHRLMCGDSGSEEDLDRLLAGATIDLLNTDPPYNVKVEPRSNNAIASGASDSYDASYQAALDSSKAKRSASLGHHQSFDLARGNAKARGTTAKMRAKDRPLINDFIPDAEFAERLLSWFGNAARVMRPGGSFYIWGGYANVANYPVALALSDLYFSQAIIWVKEHPVLTRKDFMGNHEWCFYGWKHDAAHRWLGPHNATDVWSVKKVSPNSMVHLTEKPVELATLAIEYSSLPGENVLDLFGGSGSTLIGCDQTGRHAYLMEMDPAYCDVIVERWTKFTGKEAVRG